MNSSVKIGRIVAPYFLVTGIGFAVSRDFYADMIAHTGTDPVLINLSGMVHFFIGICILVFHWRWRGVLALLVSLIGVMFLLKGIFLIALPELTLQTNDNPAQLPWAMSIGFISMGIVVGYLAYFRSSTTQISS